MEEKIISYCKHIALVIKRKIKKQSQTYRGTDNFDSEHNYTNVEIETVDPLEITWGNSDILIQTYCSIDREVSERLADSIRTATGSRVGVWESCDKQHQEVYGRGSGGGVETEIWEQLLKTGAILYFVKPIVDSFLSALGTDLHTSVKNLILRLRNKSKRKGSFTIQCYGHWFAFPNYLSDEEFKESLLSFGKFASGNKRRLSRIRPKKFIYDRKSGSWFEI